jgi:deoxyhypusine synthase
VEEVKNLEPKEQTIDELIKQMKMTAFNARRLGEAADIVEEMVKDKKCVKFLSLSGALVPAGMRGCIVEMVRCGWVDIIISTGANITHDISQSFGEKYVQCDPEKADDLKLREKGMDRIYDMYSPLDTMETMEKNIQKILSGMKAGEYSTFEIINEIGSKIEDRESIVRAAFENNVKIMVPAFTDSILGIQTWLASQDNKIKIDPMKDLGYLINLNFDLKRDGKNTGCLILGGGVPKNFVLQQVLVADKPHKYVVQVTTDSPHWGGLSGATLEEAISWGKLDEKSKHCIAYCDVTIAFPMIVSALLERLKIVKS